MTENMFGAQTTNVLTKFTVWLGGAFFALTLLLAVLYAKQASGESKLASQILIEEEVIAPDSPAPAAVPAPEEVKIQAEEIVVEPAPSETTAPAKAPETSLFDAPQAPTDTAPAEAAPAEAPENP